MKTAYAKAIGLLLDTGNLMRNSEESRNSTFGLIPEVVKPRNKLVLLNTEVNNSVNSPHRNMHKKKIKIKNKKNLLNCGNRFASVFADHLILY